MCILFIFSINQVQNQLSCRYNSVYVCKCMYTRGQGDLWYQDLSVINEYTLRGPNIYIYGQGLVSPAIPYFLLSIERGLAENVNSTPRG